MAASSSPLARLALGLGILGVLVAAGTTLGAHYAALSPLIGFRVATSALFLCGTLTACLGAVALFRGWSRGIKEGRGLAIVATLFGIALLLALAIPGAQAAKVPPIHDLTTNIDDPPVFIHAQTLVANQGRSLDYPDGLENTASLQREGYPELRPLELNIQPDVAYQRSLAAAQALGWQVTWRLATEHRFEATESTELYRFTDDVSVRIRPLSGPDGGVVGSIVDVRSVSRVGLGDVGTNAERIERFFDQLDPR
ncbi:MAG: DUF1499 domain-containing protein [Acidobacteriota bacterium]